VANASHELRTTCEEMLATSRQEEQIIRALLTQERSQRSLEHREHFDLARTAHEVLSQRAGQTEAGDCASAPRWLR